MQNKVFLNSQFINQEDAKVSVFDRGFLFADGVYEVVPVIDGQLIDRQPFLQRLINSLSALSIKWPRQQLTNFGDSQDQQIVAIFNQLIEQNQLQQGGIYLQVTRGTHFQRDFAYPEGITPTVMAFSFAKNIADNPLAETGVEVVFVDDIRWQRRDIKSIALLGQCIAKQQAAEQDAFEGWMVEDGKITEGTSSSAYIVKHNCIVTRPLSNSILPGIRRKVLLQLCQDHNIQFQQRLFSKQEALNADEAFITSATTLVLPVVKIHGQTIGNGTPGAITQKMRALYMETIAQQLNDN